VSKFDSDGNFIWARTWGGGGLYELDDIGYAVMADNSGHIYVTGQYAGTVDFNPGPGADYHTATEYYIPGYTSKDSFFCKLGEDGFW
jgi:hypothetical protein